jgi:hypothetical protein
MDSKSVEGIYSEITPKEKECLYEEIYKHGIIDDMYAMGFLSMLADYSLLPRVAHLLLDRYKDKPLHPADTEKYFQYPENYTVSHNTDYPDQNTIQRLIFTGRILEYLNKSRGKFSFGFDYDFVKRYMYHYRLNRAFGLREHADEENVNLTELKIHEKESHIVLPTLRDNVPEMSKYALQLFHCATLPTLIPRTAAQKHLDDFKSKYEHFTVTDTIKLVFADVMNLVAGKMGEQ